MEQDTDIGSNTDDFVAFYPNPVSKIFYITYDNKIQSVDILNISGQKIKTIDYNSVKSGIDISNLPNEIYFVQLKVADELIFKKIVVLN